MQKFEEIVIEQNEQAVTLQKTILNLKKAPKERRTQEYLKKKLEELDESWTKFQRLDNALRRHPQVLPEHAYFTQDLYATIGEKYNTARDEIEQELRSLISASLADEPTGTIPKTTTKKDSTQQKALVTQQNITTKLIHKQKVINEIINDMINKVMNDKTPRTSSYYLSKAKIIEGHWNAVQRIHDQIIESLDDFDSANYDLKIYLQNEDYVNEQLLKIQQMGEDSKQNFSSRTEVPIINLPNVTLPKFDGNYLKWNQFYDTFREMIDSKPLAKIQKMWYLKSNLAGEAERLIRHFSLTEENYQAAWTTLQDRYNNKRIIISSALDRLLEQPKRTHDHTSVSSLKSLHDITKETLMVLGNLGLDITSWDPIIMHVLLKKVDKETHTTFEQSLESPREPPAVKNFLQFLEKRFQALESIGGKDKFSSNKAVSSVTASSLQLSIKCEGCNSESHSLFACPKFLKLTTNERWHFLKAHKLCINCLKSGHMSKECMSRKCTKCHKKHNTLLHFEKLDTNKSKLINNKPTKQAIFTNSSGEKVATEASVHPQPMVSLTTSEKSSSKNYTLLSTALVRLEASNGRFIECRALLDSGSQVNLITERIARKLELSTKPSSMIIEGIGHRTKRARRRANLQLSSRNGQYSTRIEAFIIPHIISPQPTHDLDITGWPIPRNFDLADPHFNIVNNVDILLGVELHYELLTGQKTKLNDQLPTLHNTVFGWILGGKIENQDTSSSPTCAMYTEKELNQQLEKFWELEEVTSPQKSLTSCEQLCESHYAANTTRDKDGRFIVRLPFTQEPSSLGESKQVALNRFYALERRLEHNPSLKQRYSEFMTEYEVLGHMSQISLCNISNPCYFIPHHCVQRPESSTTKLRVVFDASSKTSTGLALNDILHIGPTIQGELFSILLRFRIWRYVFTSDIEKMYRQIWINHEDRKYQLIFWRQDKTKELKCYQLNTVTYGTRTAPYLAIKCLQKLGQQYQASKPTAAAALLNDFYVDDCLTGTDNLATAIEIQRELTSILKAAGFNLRKWCSNHPKLLQDIPVTEQEINLEFNSNEDKVIKTLGLIWLPKTDELCVKVNLKASDHITKRTILSDIASIFDPLGFLGPVVITAKILIQELWKLKIDWDENLPTHIHKQWTSFRESLPVLNNTKINRHVLPQGTKATLQIHAFADASEKAYGAVIYVRSIDKNSVVIMRLLCAKSRVAPTKRQTLPRLELCAAVLCAQLANRVKKDLDLKDAPTFFWTDSEIVLSWIRSSSSSFKTFVANRVSIIQRQSHPTQWRHVKSKQNPADLISRGIQPKEFNSCSLWFYGPFFLHGKESTWLKDCNIDPTDTTNDPERKQNTSVVAATSQSKGNLEEMIYGINHRNSFKTLVHIIAYLYKFIRKAKNEPTTSTADTFITPEEQRKALDTIIKGIQQSDFMNEVTLISNKKPLNKNSHLISLNPFIDDKGILRVGGRLEHASISYDAKHPIILPYNDPLVKLLIKWFHEEHYHCGAQALLAHLRQRFWPIKGKTMVRSVVQKCVRCARARPKLFTQIMGNLPKARIQPARPFINSGVDFCGPFWIHYKTRGKRPQKAYVAVFCCFASKAVHLEIVTDLSSDAFIGCLKRFIGRRGHCANLYCDNATNFVGAKNQLADLREIIHSENFRTCLTRFCSDKSIKFHFIPPRAPHFGGLWEAAVKSAKNLFLKGTANASLTYEELETVMVEIEAILNSRPLTPLSNDPNDLSILTPGHFLIGEPLTAQIDTTATPSKATLLQRWKLVSHLKHTFWRQWVKEYLNELQTRHKWKSTSDNAKEGMMVIIKEDNTAPLQWPLGRITKVYPGDDNKVRVADVRTSKGTFKRPIHRLAPLPLEHQSEEPNIQTHDSDSPEDQDHHEPEAKKPKKDDSSDRSNVVSSSKKQSARTKAPSLIALFTCLFILPTVLSSSVTINTFSENAGIHFEKMGTTHISSTHWTLIIYYNLSPLKSDIQTLENGSNTILHLCEQIQQKSLCEELVTQLQRTEHDLRIDHSLLALHRQRRGAVNLIGNVANALFGVLDNDYANEMSKTISHIETNENYLLNLLKNQTSVLDATINIMKHDQDAASETFTNLQHKIETLKNHISKAEHDIDESRRIQILTTLALDLILISSNINRVQSLLLSVLTNAHHGQISPLLLTPQQLKIEVKRIKSHLPPDTKIPSNEEDPLSFYKLMSVQAGLSINHVIFKITFPLMNAESFILYRLIPIPVLMNNTMVTIRLSTPILAITLHRDKYFPTNMELLQQCQMIQYQDYLCPNMQPIFQKGANKCACEISLFHNESRQLCELMKDENENWIKSSTKNVWFFALATPTQITAICGTKASQHILKGAGSLQIDPNCVVKTNTATLIGSQTLTTNSSDSYTSFGGISAIAMPNQLVWNDTTDQPYLTQLKELTALQKVLTTKEMAELPRRLQLNHYHSSAIGYLALFAVVIMGAVIYIKRKRQQADNKPTPIPRNFPADHPSQPLPTDEVITIFP